MSNQKNEWNFQDNVTKKEFKILYDTLKRAKLPFSTEHNAMSEVENVPLSHTLQIILQFLVY